MTTRVFESGDQHENVSRRKKRSPRGHRATGTLCPQCQHNWGPRKHRCPRDGTRLSVLDPLVGKVVGGAYRLDAHIGAGGMADIYRATHITLPGPFAVKVLSPRGRRDPLVTKRFIREAQAQAAIDHEHALRVLGHGYDPRLDIYFMGMEFIEGEDLRDLVRKEGPLPFERAAHMMCQVLDALAAGHRQGVLHRDLKPQNIMMIEDDDGRECVRVLDFGGKRIERGLPHSSRLPRTVLTRPGTLFGTPAYMAPEQARGEPLDERADVFAAAVTLSYLLTGKNNFKGKDIVDTLRRILTAEAPRLSRDPDLAAPVPVLFDEVLGKALAKDPKDRFASVQSFRAALAQCIQSISEMPPVVDADPPTYDSVLSVFRSMHDEVAGYAAQPVAA